jgi:hypothetical protein
MGDETVQRWSAAMREWDVLEPWLTESHLDEHYWDDVAERVATDDRVVEGREGALAALGDALRLAFPGAPLEGNNGLFREQLAERMDRIVTAAIGSPS